MEKDYIIGRGKQKDRVLAGDLLCYWTVAELGMSIVDPAKKCDMMPAAVIYSVQPGKEVEKERGPSWKVELF